MDLKRSIKKNIRLLTALTLPRTQWNIGIVDKPIQSFIDEKDYDVEWFPFLGGSRFLADPFGTKIGAEVFIFMEEYDCNKRKGKISYIKLDENSNSSKIETAIERPYHMSYPYLFEYENRVYCVPETWGINEVTIYRIRTPTDWERKHIIIEDVGISDPSLIEYDGRWWLFFTRGYDYTDLYLWYANDLFDDWHPHKKNPVKSDARSSRPAGTMFVHDGKLYRPAQNCEEYYGASITINQVMKMSPMEFLERPVSVIAPNDAMVNGVHTISPLEGMTLIDGFRYIGRDRLWLKGRISDIARYLLKKVPGRG